MDRCINVYSSVAFHDKVLKAGDEAFGAFVRAAAWSMGRGTDGFIPEEQALLFNKKLTVWQDLEQCGLNGGPGLIEKVEGGWRIHDFLDYNMSAADLKASLKKDAERKRATRSVKRCANKAASPNSNQKVTLEHSQESDNGKSTTWVKCPGGRPADVQRTSSGHSDQEPVLNDSAHLGQNDGLGGHSAAPPAKARTLETRARQIRISDPDPDQNTLFESGESACAAPPVAQGRDSSPEPEAPKAAPTMPCAKPGNGFLPGLFDGLDGYEAASETQRAGAGRSSQSPPKTRKARAATKTPCPGVFEAAMGWELWRPLYAASRRHYGPYVSNVADGAVMKRLVRAAVETARTEQTLRGGEGGETALRQLVVEQLEHWFIRFLQDDGFRDYLTVNRHGIRFVQESLSKYGSPWKHDNAALSDQAYEQFSEAKSKIIQGAA